MERSRPESNKKVRSLFREEQGQSDRVVSSESLCSSKTSNAFLVLCVKNKGSYQQIKIKNRSWL